MDCLDENLKERLMAFFYTEDENLGFDSSLLDLRRFFSSPFLRPRKFAMRIQDERRIPWAR